jgi:hypothetical protein
MPGWLDWLSPRRPAPPAPAGVDLRPPAAAATDPLGLPDFLARLRIGDRSALTGAHFEASAKRLGVQTAVIRAVVEVECAGSAGFADSGLPLILFEPHVFSELTGGRFDQSNPDVSYPELDLRKYPQSQELRWRQLAKAFILDRDAALQAASWGAFQMLGRNFAACGFPNPAAFAASVSGSPGRQLEAFEAFIDAHKLLPALKQRRWRDFARAYNGPRYADSYARKLEAAYKAIKRA